jgi:hypothetical protein
MSFIFIQFKIYEYIFNFVHEVRQKFFYVLQYGANQKYLITTVLH